MDGALGAVVQRVGRGETTATDAAYLAPVLAAAATLAAADWDNADAWRALAQLRAALAAWAQVNGDFCAAVTAQADAETRDF